MKQEKWSKTLSLTSDRVLLALLMPQAMYFLGRSWIVRMIDGGFDEEVLDISSIFLYFSLCMTVLFFFSLFRMTALYNKPLREKFWESGAITFKEKLLFVLRSGSFWIGGGVLWLVYLILPFGWTNTALSQVIRLNHSLADQLVTFALFFAVTLLLAILAQLSACRVWQRNKKPGRYDRDAYNREGFIDLLVYAATVSLSPMIIPMGTTFFPFFGKLLAKLLRPALIITVVTLIVAFLLYRTIRAFRKRSAFLGQLKTICEQRGYPVTEIRAPYRSTFQPGEGESFQITTGENTYSCKLIGAHRKYTPITVYPNGEFHLTHTVRLLKAKLFEYTTILRFGYESEHPKILIINPTPKFVYGVNDGRSFEIDNGDHVGEYKVYTATAFLRALDRDVLHRD